MSEINLLRDKQSNVVKKEKAVKLVRTVAIITAIITATLAVGLFFLNIDPTLSNIKNQEVLLTNQLLQEKTPLTNHLLIVDRLMHSQSIINNRQHFENAIDATSALLPQDITVDTVAFSKEGMNLTVSSSSLASLGSLLDGLSQSVAQKKLLKTLTIDGVVADEKTGRYFLSVHGKLL